MTEHRPGKLEVFSAGKAQSKWVDALVRFGWCALGYAAGCLASGLWVVLYIGALPNTAGFGKDSFVGFYMVAMFTGLYAFPAAPALILLGEIMKWRSLLAYIPLAIVAALASALIWMRNDLDDFFFVSMIAGAGLFSGSAFWLLAIRRRRVAVQPNYVDSAE